VVSAGLVVVACGGPSAPHAGGVQPARIIATTSALLGAGLPQTNGSLWLLAGGSGDKTLQQLNLVSGNVEHIVPVEGTAQFIAQSPDGTLAVGDNDGHGTVHFRDPASGAILSTVTVGAPIKDITADGGAGQFFVLDGTATATTVNLVAVGNKGVIGAIGVAQDSVALVASPDGSQLYILSASGSVSVVPNAPGTNNTATTTFPVGTDTTQIALSGDGSTLFVLSTENQVGDVDVVNVATERRSKILPAPSDSVNLAVSLDGTQIYVLVASPTVGNIQVFPVGR
jgi:DNA-binding beta-propeller fold protein YncE